MTVVGVPGADRAARLARYYDLDLLDGPDDLALYEALVERLRGPVIELGAGSGRLAVPLASGGASVVAVDLDPAMLQRCETRWQAERGRRPVTALRIVQGDLREVRLGADHALAFIAANGIAELGDLDAQADAVRALAAHLRPGGLAVVDVVVPAPDDLAAWDGRLTLEWVRSDPETGEQVMKLMSARYDASEHAVEIVQCFDALPADGGAVHRTTRVDRLRLPTAGELRLMARAAGLEVEAVAGDHDLGPLEPGAPRAILVARRPA